MGTESVSSAIDWQQTVSTPDDILVSVRQQPAPAYKDPEARRGAEQV